MKTTVAGTAQRGVPLLTSQDDAQLHVSTGATTLLLRLDARGFVGKQGLKAPAIYTCSVQVKLRVGAVESTQLFCGLFLLLMAG